MGNGKTYPFSLPGASRLVVVAHTLRGAIPFQSNIALTPSNVSGPDEKKQAEVCDVYLVGNATRIHVLAGRGQQERLSPETDRPSC